MFIGAVVPFVHRCVFYMDRK